MSVKPIQDEVQVSEVGQIPDTNKISIDSQMLPLPPMTMGEFEDLVGNIIQDSTSTNSPKSINIDEPTISLPQNSEVSETNVTSSSIQDALSTVSGLESRVIDMLAQIEAKNSANSSVDGSGLTTREYVDQVLGGERNLEGKGLVEAGNFLGKEEGITFQYDSENNTFDMMQGGEIIQEDMTPREANDWIASKETEEASKNDEASSARTTESGDSHQPEPFVTVVNDEDIATSSAKPFAFDGSTYLFLNDNTQTVKLDLFQDIQDNPKKDYYCYKFSLNKDGKLGGPDVVFKDKDGNTTIPTDIADLVVFENDRQTALYYPFALAWQGELQMLVTGGVYKLFEFCVEIQGKKIKALFPQKLI